MIPPRFLLRTQDWVQNQNDLYSTGYSNDIAEARQWFREAIMDLKNYSVEVLDWEQELRVVARMCWGDPHNRNPHAHL